jgi:NAD(P)-dependent dehydrogenase (short-subunit alcohol dehydrogenase family)
MSSQRGVAVVTGGSRGIGAATAVRLAGQGWDVVVGYHRDERAAGSVVRRCEDAGVRATCVPADVGDAGDVPRLFAAADGLGRLDVLVSCAGIVAPAARVDELTAERIDRLFAVNVTGTLLCAGEAVRRMSTRHGGSGGKIVNVSSTAARLGSPGEYVDYAATKGAVDTVTLGLAREVAGEGIRVNAVRPGLIDTDIHASGGRPERVELLRSTVPLGRPGRADEVAAAIVHLCSDEAGYTIGALVDVGGGR